MSRDMAYTQRWNVGEWQFFEIDGRQISDSYEGRKLYGYEVQAKDGARPEVGNVREWFNSLDRALIAAVGEKYTGPRGAGGTGVGTAADWFARMIGMDQLVAVNYQDGQKALLEAVTATRDKDGPLWSRARAIGAELEARGLTLAAQVHP